MKAVYVFNLTVLTGFAAIGLLAAEAAHAQAPSGPITAAPSQPAPANAANAPNPAPLPAPRTTILGAWKFNPDDSDDPSKRRQDSRGSNGGGNGGGRGRIGGGWPGGGGRGGGYGGRRGGGGKEGEGQKMDGPFTPAEKITVSVTGAEVDLGGDPGRKRGFMTHRGKLKKTKGENNHGNCARV